MVQDDTDLNNLTARDIATLLPAFKPEEKRKTEGIIASISAPGQRPSDGEIAGSLPTDGQTSGQIPTDGELAMLRGQLRSKEPLDDAGLAVVNRLVNLFQGGSTPQEEARISRIHDRLIELRSGHMTNEQMDDMMTDSQFSSAAARSAAAASDTPPAPAAPQPPATPDPGPSASPGGPDDDDNDTTARLVPRGSRGRFA